MHVCRIQEGFICHPRGITTILYKTLQNPRKMFYHKNEYNLCVMKKIVKGKQCTILSHVDDIKMLHVDSDIVSIVLSDIDIKYGNIVKMIITQGKIHKILPPRYSEFLRGLLHDKYF